MNEEIPQAVKVALQAAIDAAPKWSMMQTDIARQYHFLTGEHPTMPAPPMLPEPTEGA